MKITEKKARKAIRDWLFEYNLDPIKTTQDKIAGNLIPDSEVPIENIQPSEEVASFLSHEKPPIEDEEWRPTTSKELAHAADAVARLVPDSQIGYFYKMINNIKEKAIDMANKPKLQDIEQEDFSIKSQIVPKTRNVSESVLDAHLERILKEVNEDEDELKRKLADAEKRRLSGEEPELRDDPYWEPSAEDLEDFMDANPDLDKEYVEDMMGKSARRMRSQRHVDQSQQRKAAKLKEKEWGKKRDDDRLQDILDTQAYGDRVKGVSGLKNLIDREILDQYA